MLRTVGRVRHAAAFYFWPRFTRSLQMHVPLRKQSQFEAAETRRQNDWVLVIAAIRWGDSRSQIKSEFDSAHGNSEPNFTKRISTVLQSKSAALYVD